MKIDICWKSRIESSSSHPQNNNSCIHNITLEMETSLKWKPVHSGRSSTPGLELLGDGSCSQLPSLPPHIHLVLLFLSPALSEMKIALIIHSSSKSLQVNLCWGGLLIRQPFSQSPTHCDCHHVPHLFQSCLPANHPSEQNRTNFTTPPRIPLSFWATSFRRRRSIPASFIYKSSSYVSNFLCSSSINWILIIGPEVYYGSVLLEVSI